MGVFQEGAMQPFVFKGEFLQKNCAQNLNPSALLGVCLKKFILINKLYKNNTYLIKL